MNIFEKAAKYEAKAERPRRGRKKPNKPKKPSSEMKVTVTVRNQ